MKKAWWALIGVGIAGVIVGIDFTIVNTSLANIERDLQTTNAQLQWVMGGFGLFFSTLIVTMGRLGDLRGRRRLLYIGVVGFGLASLGAGWSQTPRFLIAMRMLQGFFGAAIIPAGMSIVAAAFPRHQRGRALSIYLSFFGIGMALGPVIGSIIVTLLSWHWIFFINIPIVLLSLLICWLVLEPSQHSEVIPIDWSGVVAIVIALASLLFAINQGPIQGWDSSLILAAFVISVVAFIIFIRIERHSKTPLIPIQLFLNRSFLIALIVYCAAVAIAWSVIFIMPLYLHTSLGLATGRVGLLIFIMTVMTVVVPPISGYFYDKRGATLLLHTTFILSLTSLAMFTQLQPKGPLWLIILSFVLFGTSWGIGNGIAIPLALSKLSDSKDSGLVSGALITLMNMIAVIILIIDTTLFGYGKKVSFIHGVHLASRLLFMISLCLWIAIIVIQHSRRWALFRKVAH